MSGELPDMARVGLDAGAGPGAFHELIREAHATMLWVHSEVAEARPLPVLESIAVSHALNAAHDERAGTIPQLPLQSMGEYVTVHSINVALLAMALAAETSYDTSTIRPIGLAALLHDIGMARVPVDLLSKSEQLDDDERELVRAHPVEGARIIVSAEAALDLPAVVAYEHHLRPDGSGYPALTYPRNGHRISRLVQVCDTYHALRSPRPFRPPWPTDAVLSFLQQRAGSEFDSDIVRALAHLIGRIGDPYTHA